MGKQRRFWWLVARRATLDFWTLIKPTGGHLVWALIQIAVAYLVLTYVPGLGDFRAKVNDGVLFAFAVLAVAAAQAIYCVMVAPARVHAAAADQAEALQVLLGRDADNDAAKAEIVALYEEGLEFYRNENSYAAWFVFPDEWIARARAAVAKHFTPEMLFEFDHSMHTPNIEKPVGINYPVAFEDLAPTMSLMRRKLYQLSAVVHYSTRAEILRRDREAATK